MGFLKSIKSVFSLALILFSAQLLGSGFDSEFEEKPWAEIEVQLPPFPETENLIPFQVGAMTDTKYLIDGNSLSIGSDDVVRYTLVVNSSSGAQNISYEGMRCATHEFRLYAFGRPDNTWSKARSNSWIRLQGSSNNHHVELFSNYFCDFGVLRTVEEVRQALRYGGQLSSSSHRR